MYAGPTSSTAMVLERWVRLFVVAVGRVRVLQVVVGDRGQTTTAQGLVAERVGWMEVSVREATGLVPEFADYPSSTID